MYHVLHDKAVFTLLFVSGEFQTPLSQHQIYMSASESWVMNHTAYVILCLEQCLPLLTASLQLHINHKDLSLHGGFMCRNSWKIEEHITFLSCRCCNIRGNTYLTRLTGLNMDTNQRMCRLDVLWIPTSKTVFLSKTYVAPQWLNIHPPRSSSGDIFVCK